MESPPAQNWKSTGFSGGAPRKAVLGKFPVEEAWEVLVCEELGRQERSPGRPEETRLNPRSRAQSRNENSLSWEWPGVRTVPWTGRAPEGTWAERNSLLETDGRDIPGARSPGSGATLGITGERTLWLPGSEVTLAELCLVLSPGVCVTPSHHSAQSCVPTNRPSQNPE